MSTTTLPFDLSVYFVTDPQLCGSRGIVATVAAAVRGGVTMVQLRDKSASDADLIALGRQVQTVLTNHPAVQLIVNDRVAVAQALGVGVHLGQADGGVAAARAVLGAHAVIGQSIDNLAQIPAVDLENTDYLGVGPVFATTTKRDHAAPLGLAGLAKLRAASPLPMVAIGGLNAQHAAAVRAAGVEGIAVVAALCTAPDPEATARQLWQAMNGVTNKTPI
ncbi:thiamine phosphate synthase [Thiospirillum jenense]|uniref:Thiamine-phosphate synthase n=1 Tax=Thiospirillum jenense TaxID=1653858 RepID=A0A839HEQ9_9GAMM|nr:thiamine phosphate synthase [Thiospirillum jenense]MBB1127343.1 thiamine phosphate synthase [Thiospirillum jenense]